MQFSYSSSREMGVKALPQAISEGLRAYLIEQGFSQAWSLGELQDQLLAYRHEGERLMIHQLEPVFVYLARYGELWPEGKEQS